METEEEKEVGRRRRRRRGEVGRKEVEEEVGRKEEEGRGGKEGKGVDRYILHILIIPLKNRSLQRILSDGEELEKG